MITQENTQPRRPDGGIDVQAQRAAHWVRDNGHTGEVVPQHSEYPKYMTHPAYQPGRPAREIKRPGDWRVSYEGGTSAMMPPVLVHNQDDEEYHAAKGYVSQGKSDPQAFARAVASAPPSNGYIAEKYPMWVGDKLVNDEAEERAAKGLEPLPELAAPPVTDDEKDDLKAQLAALQAQEEKRASELAALQAQMAALLAQRAPAVPEEPPPEIDALRRDLEAAGVKVDGRWSIATLREELEKATAPEATA